MKRRWLVLVLACLGAGEQSLFTQGKHPLRDVTPPPGLSLSVASCAACHAEETADWRRSWHAKATTDPVFIASVTGAQGEVWCRNCHSPLPEQQAVLGQLPDGLASEGINCAVCHIRDGVVLSANPVPEDPQGPHLLVYSPDLGEASFCGGCHQFSIPVQKHFPKVRYSHVPMQDTLHEWSQTDAPPCQDCHMPDGRHTFPGAHDRDWMKGVIDIAVYESSPEPGDDPRWPDWRAEAVLTATGAGHRIPTGDPFRRLFVEICADPACERVVGEANAVRHFVGEKRWREGVDLSIPAPARTGEPASRTLRILVDAPPPWWYRLSYQFVEDRLIEKLDPNEVGFVLDTAEVRPASARTITDR